MEMTFISSERQAILKMIDYIEGERLRLWGENVRLLDRLRELDDIERLKSQPESTIEEDLVENEEKHVTDLTEETEVETATQEEVVETAQETTIEPSGKMSLAEAIDVYNKQVEAERENISDTLSPFQQNAAFIRDLEIMKDVENKRKIAKKRKKGKKYRNTKEVAYEVRTILKDAGRPVKTSDLIEQLKQTGIEIANPYTLLTRVKQQDPRIEKASFGYYQYKG
jgi:hypothetical protein